MWFQLASEWLLEGRGCSVGEGVGSAVTRRYSPISRVVVLGTALLLGFSGAPASLQTPAETAKFDGENR